MLTGQLVLLDSGTHGGLNLVDGPFGGWDLIRVPHCDGEFYGDASSVAGQGLVTYDFAKELPFSGLPAGCTFRIKGVAPDASLVDSSQIDTPPSSTGLPESQVVADRTPCWGSHDRNSGR